MQNYARLKLMHITCIAGVKTQGDPSKKQTKRNEQFLPKRVHFLSFTKNKQNKLLLETVQLIDVLE